ncbi:MAG: alanine--tRNA ligase [Firmicutes bacterium]|nr:alanine--tRNA ligase [Bacillota bacterium]MDH7495595.1 alanine--tRNA ligase [Bacillota bacterium]
MYREFFIGKGHKPLPSASLIPRNDPTLLLTGAGMVPFKPYFLGTAKPESQRVTTCQKCVRTLDIDNVGKTARHLTFFEMLGNFSFGDYFKKEAIPWAWEFVTRHLGLTEDRLWVTIYLDDDEAFEIWNKDVGVASERIKRFGKKDNFWEIGVGPCGPCSEIHVDRGEEFGCGRPGCELGCDCDRFMEIWNLVFIQFHHDEAGNYIPLERKGIDTGMGLDRVAAVMQGVPTVFDTDAVSPVTRAVAELGGVVYGERGRRKGDSEHGRDADVSVRIITDHARAVTFLVADGVLPANEGRGYVLRRLIRRAVRHGRLLGITRAFLADVADVITSVMGGVYPELVERRDHIRKTLSIEEERFIDRLDQGTSILQDVIEGLRSAGKNEVPGEEAFRLYDTFGFPAELTREIAQESGMTVDEAGFAAAMKEQRERARAARQDLGYMGDLSTAKAQALSGLSTKFVGYETTSTDARVSALFVDGEPVSRADIGQTVEIVLDVTPFYGEAGGQVGDSGTITGQAGRARVTTAVRASDAITVHNATVEDGGIAVGDVVKAEVDGERRLAIARNHTATHLLHAALRRVLGDHVFQSGSLVADDRLRFDFSHHSAMTDEEIRKVEDMVLGWVLADVPVRPVEMTLDEAKAIGAMALFGEKYGERVRVVGIADCSNELCGGTHVGRTGEIGLVKILSETAVAAGVRRVEAVTGRAALEFLRSQQTLLERASEEVRSRPEELPQKLARMAQELRAREKEIESLRAKMTLSQVDALLAGAVEVDGAKIVVAETEIFDPAALRELADGLRARVHSGAVVLGSRSSGKVLFVATVTKDLIDRGLRAGDIVKAAAEVAGGGGGGRPDMAQAGGRDVTKLKDALGKAMATIERALLH